MQAQTAKPLTPLFGQACDPEQAAVHVIPVPFDATCSYRLGAAAGPAAIRRASTQVDLFDLPWGSPWQAGIYMEREDEEVQLLNREGRALVEQLRSNANCDRPATLERMNTIGVEVNRRVAARTNSALAAGQLPLVLGGDHSAPFGSIAAVASAHPGLGLLHIDAHADMRVAYEGLTWSHASIIHNVLSRIQDVAVVLQVGLRDLCAEEWERITDGTPRINCLADWEWTRERLAGSDLSLRIDQAIECLPQDVYITLDVDGLEPSLCPQTGTPVPGGLTWGEVCLWLERLVDSGRRIVGLDLCEVSGGSAAEGGADSWDAIVGARLLYKMIGAALGSRE
ncbi:MAG: agmatinase family protein [Planctomycetota bacterium]|nr:agmatinase family protein [Planctomycetota bacterium]